MWPTACEAGWPGLLIDEAHGGAGLDAFDAMLVLGECGRVLAGIPLLGHLPATAILNDSPERRRAARRAGQRRAARGVPARAARPSDVDGGWSGDPRERPRARAGCRRAGRPARTAA